MFNAFTRIGRFFTGVQNDMIFSVSRFTLSRRCRSPDRQPEAEGMNLAVLTRYLPVRRPATAEILVKSDPFFKSLNSLHLHNLNDQAKTSMIQLRQAGPADIPLLIELANATWFETYLPILPEGQAAFMFERIFSEQALASSLLSEKDFSWLAFEEKKPAAFAMMSSENQEPGALKISKLYVHPTFQGWGLGKTLLHTIEQQALEKGFTSLTLNVNRFNEKAISFYKKHNFTIQYETDIRYFQFWLNDFVMSRNI
jgi:diamine N-acetyltransferase